LKDELKKKMNWRKKIKRKNMLDQDILKQKIFYIISFEQKKKGLFVNYILVRLQICKILKESAIYALYPIEEYEF